MRPTYIVEKSPHNGLWYCLGAIRTKAKTYYMPVSDGYIKKSSAEAFMKKQPYADKDAVKCINDLC